MMDDHSDAIDRLVILEDGYQINWLGCLKNFTDR